MFEIKGKYNTAFVFQTRGSVEDSCLKQIETLMNQPFVENEDIRIMPDCHTGVGVCIGYTQTLRNRRVCPSLVGVDIGCGVLVVNLGKNIGNFDVLDMVIRENIPSGNNIHNRPTTEMNFDEFHCSVSNKDRILRSMGTLGGGNHFIEIDTDGVNYYLVIHTGSRNLGVQVANFHQDLAYKLMSKPADVSSVIADYKARGLEKELSKKLQELKAEAVKPSKEYSFLEGGYFDDYISDMKLCQKYAHDNREAIATVILNRWLGKTLNDFEHFETIHNYIDTENMLIRKGAVAAASGTELIIPINMAEGSLICEGKDFSNMNCSAPHGAGRLMSRAEAKKAVSLEEFKDVMSGIYSTCVSSATLDESPMAYKKLKDVLPHIESTVKVKKIIKPVYNFKAAE
jgi:tRNA-splicing ligase RtcB (3'-phosphate/5'-hydroxy nucleic acid ligase)